MIIPDASVKWKLTVWPLMDMANVTVSTLVAGPQIGGLGPNVRIYGAHHRFFPWIIDMVLRSLHHVLIFYRRK